ncbi:hypothetical protein [Streptomyces sp. NPDC006463]|uniref:hypothetical protein n=1 Tax=Streptomyces sp. NPDC006463 TaxID=3364746 RepID=UPI003697530E
MRSPEAAAERIELDAYPALGEVLARLAQARQFIDDAYDAYGPDGQLARVALHLIDCAADASALLGSRAGDLEAAREALGTARSAVVAATCAVRHTHDDMKATTP